MTDDWEIESSTVDVRYRWDLGSSSYLEPHIRFYSQDGCGILYNEPDRWRAFAPDMHPQTID